MSAAADLPPPDAIPGAPHPRETPALFGHDTAQAEFLAAFNDARLHHAWLLTGPRGIGKATLAWRIARFLLATPPDAGAGLAGVLPPPETLDVAADHPVARRMRAGSEPGLASITRSPNDKGDRMRDEIVVDDIRRLNRFFGLSATDGGRRVVIVDAADDMNANAANALLKMLEEPPARTTLLLVAHRPSRLLPTIRSRCRTLRMGALTAPDMAAALEQAGLRTDANPLYLAELAAGSVGAAMRLIALEGLPLYAGVVSVLDSLPGLDRQRALALAERAAVRGAGASERQDLLFGLIDVALARLARTGATGRPPPEAAPNEAATLMRLSPDARRAGIWAETAATIAARTGHGRAVNLDPAALVLDTVIRLQHTAAS